MAPPLYSVCPLQGKILIATVGLPARGKTYLSHAIQRYLLWLGVNCKVFNLANLRRDVLGAVEDLPPDYFGTTPRSDKTQEMRDRVKRQLEQQIAEFFDNGGQVAIYDANNSNRRERRTISAHFAKLSIQVMFIESRCDNSRVVERNIRSMHHFSPDYIGWPLDAVFEDLERRIKRHEGDYEPITDPSLPHVQLLNLGEHIVVNNVNGYLQNRIVFFLMNFHIEDRTIYFARAGEALIEHLYKADAELSSLGTEYSVRLCDFVLDLREHGADRGGTNVSQLHTVSWLSSEKKPQSMDRGTEDRPLQVWVSTRKRSVLTATPFRERGCRVAEHSRLCEMNPGVVDGMSDEEIAQRFSDSMESKTKDPYTFRFPRAESYHDLAIRLEPIIFELERTREDVLIIAQSSVLRCLIAYLQGNSPRDIPFIQVREGDLVEIYPQAFGVSTRVYPFWDPKKKREDRDIVFAERAAAALALQEAAVGSAASSQE
ncbi:hypothetical protein MSPP1_002718 [Malassezia sp. CBS 17886]|nr:hypothetical protein MSPP1_002718 [Malassezia sp. CBS 17886]